MTRKTILVVDDNDLVLRSVVAMFRGRDDVRVIARVTYIDAVRIMDGRPSEDLYAVVTDYDLGNGTGPGDHHGLALLRRAPVGTIRVLMSGEPPRDTAPADHVLEKPFRAADLRAALGLKRREING